MAGWQVRIAPRLRPDQRRILAVVLFVAAVVVGSTLAGQAEQATPAPDVLSALLTEVRGLRAAMEHAGLAEVRFRFDFEGTKVAFS